MDGVFDGASMGTPASLVSRLVLTVCSIASLLIIFFAPDPYDSNEYNSYSFRLLACVMGLLIPWSLAMAVADGYFIFILRNRTRKPGLTRAVVATDWMFAFMSFAASSATASTADFLFPACGITACHHYQIAAATGFLCYVLLYGFSLFNLWILPWL
ncbi:unnamed protein product [Cuscuta epithymum]|uniref:CASP-like protein n=1 Tax=Cuscuta epithymum TaxID=186058 RepID=A0AAV0DNL0_9ASTE|nr:unnamed protein product [Cuscuta epithymum]